MPSQDHLQKDRPPSSLLIYLRSWFECPQQCRNRLTFTMGNWSSALRCDKGAGDLLKPDDKEGREDEEERKQTFAAPSLPDRQLLPSEIPPGRLGPTNPVPKAVFLPPEDTCSACVGMAALRITMAMTHATVFTFLHSGIVESEHG
jgi:hypothetical protein